MSKINKLAAMRISSSNISGPQLLEIFRGLEENMKKTGAEMEYAQFQFVVLPSEMKQGDLIPELHFVLRPYMPPLISEPVEFTNAD